MPISATLTKPLESVESGKSGRSSEALRPRGKSPLVLEMQGIEVCYGTSQALFGIDLEVRAGECVTLIGRNGMGKSTTVKSLAGILRPKSGHIRLFGNEIRGLAPFRIARLGLGLVPEGRQIFPTLTVWENLVATAADRLAASAPWTVEKIFALFPRLRERRNNFGGNLSGGEQQMLAIGRALMTNPRLLVLDEATEGIDPLTRAEIWKCLERLKASGLSLIVIDKNIGPIMKLGDWHYIFEKGRVVWGGSSEQLRKKPEILREHVGL